MSKSYRFCSLGMRNTRSLCQSIAYIRPRELELRQKDRFTCTSAMTLGGQYVAIGLQVGRLVLDTSNPRYEHGMAHSEVNVLQFCHIWLERQNSL